MKLYDFLPVELLEPLALEEPELLGGVVASCAGWTGVMFTG
jgi:hypothetical protein